VLRDQCLFDIAASSNNSHVGPLTPGAAELFAPATQTWATASHVAMMVSLSMATKLEPAKARINRPCGASATMTGRRLRRLGSMKLVRSAARRLRIRSITMPLI
jgi:hypothetical protein